VVDGIGVAQEAAREPARTTAARSGLTAAVALGGLVGLSAVLRFVAALGVPSPWYMPDEVIYAELGRSLFSEGRFEILGETAGFYGVVYPALIGLPLAVLDPQRAHDVLQAVQAIVMSLAAVPIYFWGRTLMSARWALVAAALTLALPGLAFAGFLMTEVAFYPVLCLAAWAMARALVRPTPANQAVVVAAVLLAALTRLQAIVLVPAFGLAIALDAAFARRWLAGLRRFLPAAVGFAALGLAWAAISVLGGGNALGAYSVTGDTGYDLGEALRFVAYHAGDLLLLTAVLPVLAVVLLAIEAARGRERSAEARAYIAVALAVSVVFVATVGVFASRFLGRLAERNLISLAPLLFLGFSLWLDRGAPRPRIATVLAGAALVALLATMPWYDLVTLAAQPDAFMTIPLNWMRETYPDLDLTLLIVVAAVELVAVFAFVPRRLAWILPAVVLALLAVISIPVSTRVADDSTIFGRAMIGADTSWIDEAADRPVTYVFGGEQPWSAGAPVWIHLFWNRDVERVHSLFGARIAGLVPSRPVRPAADGRLLSPGGRPAAGAYALGPSRLTFFGQRLAASEARLTLWRVDPPLRLSSRTTGLDATGLLSSTATMVVYDCRGGELLVTLRAPAPATVFFLRGKALVREVALQANEPWSGGISAAAPAGPGPSTCRFALEAEGPVHAERLDFVRAA
jgi:hypothetical protein